MQNNPVAEPFCVIIKNKNPDKYHSYRNYTLSALKLLIGYIFPSHCFKILRNNSEMRFDIYLLKKNSEGIEVNIQEVQNFRSYWGGGFNIKIISETDIEMI